VNQESVGVVLFRWYKTLCCFMIHGNASYAKCFAGDEEQNRFLRAYLEASGI
jgi:hypothetical protein